MKKANRHDQHIITSLREGYNSIADKFSGTRERVWPEFQLIKDDIIKHRTGKNPPKILELWCWDGRLFRYLTEQGIECEYTWIDLSDNLILLALERSPTARRHQSDMIHYLEQSASFERDIVIMVASFNHIYSDNLRKHTLDLIYDRLADQWLLIMTNRSWSKWFLSKYFTLKNYQLIRASVYSFLTKRKWKWNDLRIWFSHAWKTARRYYHIFTRSELLSLCKISWFFTILMWYTDNDGKLWQDRKVARNLYTVCKKTRGR